MTYDAHFVPSTIFPFNHGRCLSMKSAPINLSVVRQIVEDCDSCLRPVKDAEILPAAAYVSEEFWEFEKQAIFGREWLAIAHVNEIPNIGDHIPLKVNDEPVIVTRDEDNRVRVLSSICQHRGHPM